MILGFAASIAVSNNVRNAARADLSFQGEAWGIDGFLCFSGADSMANPDKARHLWWAWNRRKIYVGTRTR
jgi:hypothetical protein